MMNGKRKAALGVLAELLSCLSAYLWLLATVFSLAKCDNNTLTLATVAKGQMFNGGPTLDELGNEIIVSADDKFWKKFTQPNKIISSKMSYVIDRKRFVESFSSRCFATTILKEPQVVEPSFLFIQAASDEKQPDKEVSLNATVQLEILKQQSGFDPQKGTIILIHGFKQPISTTCWMRRIQKLFRENQTSDRYNLIIMDWTRAAYGPYHRVAGASSVVSSYLANFMMKLVELGASPESIHLVGHSIGCHLAGLAGKKMSNSMKIGRITALDPAGPCFRGPSGGAGRRLSPGDAHQVAVYHYDDAFVGLPGQHGHFDVYVNGGWSQPDTPDNKLLILLAILKKSLAGLKPVSDAHMRPIHMYATQMAHANCQQVAYQCSDYKSFLAGECGHCDHQNNQCFFMGLAYQYKPEEEEEEAPVELGTLRATAGPVLGKRMFISTSSNGTFCQQHYQILVKLEDSRYLKKRKVHLRVKLTNERHETIDIKIKNQMEPNVYSYLLLTDTAPASFHSASLWIVGKSKKSQAQTVAAKNIEINFMSHKKPNVRRKFSSILCPRRISKQMDQSTGDSNGQAQILQQCQN